MEVRRDWLHGGELDARWEACASPERPPDREIYFEIGCAGCRIALEAAVRAEPAPGRFRGWFEAEDLLALFDDAGARRADAR